MLGPDPLREQRLALRADYLGDFPAEHYADAFVDAVRHVAAAGAGGPGRREDRGATREAEEAPGRRGRAVRAARTRPSSPGPPAGLRRYPACCSGSASAWSPWASPWWPC